MNQRLSRKEIKRDEFMESLGGAFEFLRSHSRQLFIAGLLVLAGIVLLAIYYGYSQRREAHADVALTQALQVYQASIDPVAANPEGETAPTFANPAARSQRAKELFVSVIEDFGRSDAAQIAKVYLGQMAVDDGDIEKARQYWQEFLDRTSQNALAVEVRVNLMALDRASGRGDELVTELRAMLSGPNADLPPDLLWYQLGLTLEVLDRKAEAIEVFQRVVDEYPQSAYAPAARERTGGTQAPLFGS